MFGPSGSRLILEELDQYHDGKVGYVVYRCTYGDDEKWARFMAQLSAFVHVSLDKEGKWDPEAASTLRGCFAWVVKDDKEQFDGAPMSKIRSNFKDWVASVNGLQALTKYTYCIYADDEVVDAMLSGNPHTPSNEEHRYPKAFVMILSDQFRDQLPQYSAKQIPDEDERAKLNTGDEGLAPVGPECCRRKDVGWMKVAADTLMTRGYKVLNDNGWPRYYVRPPTIVND